MDGCSGARAEYLLALDRSKVTATRGTLDFDMRLDCGIVQGFEIRWALVLAGPISEGTSAMVTNPDPRQSTEKRVLRLRPFDDAPIYTAQGDALPTVFAAGIECTDIIGELHLKFSFANTGLGQRNGARVAIAAPSVDSSVEGLDIPGEFFIPYSDASPASGTVSTEKIPKVSTRYTAGRLNTAERVEFSSPSLADPGTLEWRGPRNGVSTLIVDTNAEQREERMLFWAGILVGLAASLLVWAAEIVLGIRGMLPTR
jgi:hypothetical protein